MPDLSRVLLKLASWLAPSAQRREFLKEWQAELDWDTRESSPIGRVRRASGAVADACALRVRDWRSMGVAQDVRLALRLCRARPAFTALITLTLALGVGGTTAIFSVVNAVMLRPLPYQAPEQLFVLWEDDRANAKPRTLVSPGAYTDWTHNSRSYERLALYFTGSANLMIDSEAHRMVVGLVSPNIHQVLGTTPLLGRGFTEGDGHPDRTDVVVLSHRVWVSRFGADPAVIGRDIVLNESPAQVIGIMPPDFFLFDRGIDVWRTHVMRPRVASLRSIGYMTVIGRLRAGVTPEQAESEMAALSAGTDRGVTIVPMADQIFGEIRRPILFLSAAAGVVLLVGCANIANLLLASGVGRRRELAVRSALGASRARIIRQLLVEATVLAAIGGVLGVALAVGASRLLGGVAAAVMPTVGDISPDWRVFTFATALSLFTGLLFAALPAFAVSRSNVASDTGVGARVIASPSMRRVGAGLVVAELMLAVLLVCGASLALRSFWRVQSVDIGLDADNVLTAQLTLPVARYYGAPIVEFYSTLLNRLNDMPEVQAAGITSVLPLADPGSTDSLVMEGSPTHAGESAQVAVRPVTPEYFDAMGLRVLEGERFTAAATSGTLPVALINQTLAQQFVPGQRIIGSRLQLGRGRGTWRTIVGVVGDVRHAGPERPAVPEVYVPMAQGYLVSSAAVVVRVAHNPVAFVPVLRSAVSALDPNVPLADIRPMRDLIDGSALGRRASTVLLAAFAGLTLALALVGVYGILAHGVSRRTQEIGVRLALGANRHGVALMVLRQGMGLAVAGLLAGQALALASGRLIQSMLFGVVAADPLTYAAVSLLVLVAAALACYLPARRAAGLDPIAALRQ